MVNKSKFIQVFKTILDSNQHNQIIRWNHNGKFVEITDIDQFSKNVMPLYFLTSNIKSFFRQLVNYGFKIKKLKQKQRQIYNKHFFYGESCLINNIIRKKSIKNNNSVILEAESDYNNLKNQLYEIKETQLLMSKQLELNMKIYRIIFNKIDSIIKLSEDEVIRDVEGQCYKFCDAMIALMTGFHGQITKDIINELKDPFFNYVTPNHSPLTL